MESKEILSYEDITKIKLTADGFLLNGQKLEELIKVEEFTFIDDFGDEQIAEYLFFMMGEGFVITAKDTNMRRYIRLDKFLESRKIEFKDSSRLKLEEKWEKQKIEENRKIEHRNNLENNKRPKEKLKVGEDRTTLIEEKEYKQLKYKITLHESYYDRDEYFLEIETKNKIYTESFFSIEKLREKQTDILEKYNEMSEIPGIFDLYIGSYQGTNIVVVFDMKEYQDILRYNNKKYNTTYKIREELINLNFKWDSYKNEWQKELKNEKETNKLVNYLREKYVNEYPDKELKGINYCWECGAAFLKKHTC